MNVKLIAAAVVLALAAATTLAFVRSTTVHPGYVGIVVNMYGTNRGVDAYPIRTGRVWYNPWSEDVYTFPIFMQTVAWTSDLKEGSTHDQSITFNSIEGAVLRSDISFSYRFVQEQVPAIFVKFNRDPQSIQDSYLRSKVRDAFGRQASTMRVADIFGEGKQKLLDAVRDQLVSELAPEGIAVDTITFIGAPRTEDPNVMNAINAAIAQAQQAVAAQNKVVQTQAEADQARAAAQGEADSEVIRAKGEAEANDIRAKSLTPELLRAKALEKWNGVLPQVQGGGATPFIEVGKQ